MSVTTKKLFLVTTMAVCSLLVGVDCSVAAAKVMYRNGKFDTNRFASYIKKSMVQTPNKTIVLIRGKCPIEDAPTDGCTSFGSNEVYLSAWRDRFAFMHEIGHQFDFGADRKFRDEFKRIMKRPDALWYNTDPEYGLPTQEIFADFYAACSIFGIKHSNWDTIEQGGEIATPGYPKPPITTSQYVHICKLINKATYIDSTNRYQDVELEGV